MTLPPLYIIGPIWGAAEFIVAIKTRARSNGPSKDRGSLGLIWAVTLLSIAAAIVAAYKIPSARFPHPKTFYFLGVAIFAVGIVWRGFSIIYLGRFFTPNVSIATDHRLIDTGPYRFIRHPTYTGSLLIVFGFGLAFANAASFALIFFPSAAVFLWRMHIEERALTDAFGEQYRLYSRRTKRLIPFIY
jgi:protein-S-isoprenylcysteine O-methyltransferase